jgi:dUTP pyrophosphatase
MLYVPSDTESIFERDYYAQRKGWGAGRMPVLRSHEIGLAPGERLLCATGYEIEIPPGYEGQVRPRSGLAHRHGVTVLNSPGTIDSDYRGELKMLLVNLSQEVAVLRHGERIAQLVVAPVARLCIVAAVELSETARGAGGFGSTGQ